MLNSSKKFLVMALIGLGIFSFSGVSSATEKDGTLTGFLRNLFHYPVRATQETAKMTSNTLNNTGNVVSNVGSTAANTVKADLPAAGSSAADMVTDTAKTVGQTAAETVQVPVKAAEEEQK